ncbi:MAG: hypothetical protein SGI71_03940 [Verrucomicrobiota bacterium]|nr:hypothetical protein [Verrucomicrobiota bacterium]
MTNAAKELNDRHIKKILNEAYDKYLSPRKSKAPTAIDNARPREKPGYFKPIR